MIKVEDYYKDLMCRKCQVTRLDMLERHFQTLGQAFSEEQKRESMQFIIRDCMQCKIIQDIFPQIMSQVRDELNERK